jgi:hypothetical protein
LGSKTKQWLLRAAQAPLPDDLPPGSSGRKIRFQLELGYFAEQDIRNDRSHQRFALGSAVAHRNTYHR